MPARKACILNEKPLASRQQKLPCKSAKQKEYLPRLPFCLLYTSDAADE